MPQLRTRPFLKWAGGKYRLLDKLTPHLKGSKLIEPFCGSGSVFLNLDFDRYLIGDINPDLINLFGFLKMYRDAGFYLDVEYAEFQENCDLGEVGGSLQEYLKPMKAAFASPGNTKLSELQEFVARILRTLWGIAHFDRCGAVGGTGGNHRESSRVYAAGQTAVPGSMGETEHVSG